MNKVRRFLLPGWARTEHPILRYELAHLKRPVSRRTRFLQLLVIVLLLVLPGYFYAAHIHAASNLSDLVWRSLYFPTLLAQVITAALALSLGIDSVGQERSRRTWDPLRATEVGAALTLRSRWLAILYRLRAPILAVLLARLILLALMLYELAAFDGLYIETLTPPFTDWRIGLLAIALIMAASLLLPLTVPGVFAGLGLLISVAIKDRTYRLTVQVMLVTAHITLTVGLLLAVSQVLSGGIRLSDNALFVLFLGYGGFGDGALLLTQLGSLDEIWALVPDAIFIGGGLLILTLLQAAAADGSLWLAVRLSEGRE